jgi:alpha-tubulin suppressor-like RCC1 family protein
LLTGKKGNIIGLTEVRKMSAADYSFLIIKEDNKLMKQLDSSIYSYEESKLTQLTEHGIDDVQITSHRFCAHGKNQELLCSGHKLNTAYLKAGGAFSCFIKPSDNKLSCWGAKNFKQVEVPAEFEQNTLFVSTGSMHVCGVQGNGSIKCWGSNDRRQTSVPKDLQMPDSAKLVEAGGEQTCAITAAGKLVCWGCNQ